MSGQAAWGVGRAARPGGCYGLARRPARLTQADVGRQAKQREKPLGVEEESEFDDPVRSRLEHDQRPRIPAASRFTRLVLAEGHSAVGPGRREQPRIATAAARAEPPGE